MQSENKDATTDDQTPVGTTRSDANAREKKNKPSAGRTEATIPAAQTARQHKPIATSLRVRDAAEKVITRLLGADADSGKPEKPLKKPRQVALERYRAAKASTVRSLELDEENRRKLPNALKHLKTVITATEQVPWLRGDAMAQVAALGANPANYPAVARILPKRTYHLGVGEIITIIRSWVEDFDKAKETQFYESFDVATTFPVEFLGTQVRCGGLSFTNHGDVLHAVRKLEKRGWLQNWNTGSNLMARRRDFLLQVAAEKQKAREAKHPFGRDKIELLVAASEFCKSEHRGKLLEYSKPTAKAAQRAPKPDAASTKIEVDGLTFYQVDTETEDRLCFVAAAYENDARDLLSKHQIDPKQMRFKPLGSLRVMAGIYELKRIEQVTVKTAPTPREGGAL